MNFTNLLNLEGFSFPGFDPATGTVTLPWWAAATVAALLVASWLLAVLRGGPAILVGSFVSIAFLALAVTIAWVGSERVTERERVVERDGAAERRALVARAQDLARDAVMPNSVLACLDGIGGETMEAGCERALFATPEAVAGALAYTATRLALLSDGADYATRHNASYEGPLAGLRAALEADRFGFVAQVLTSQYGCSADHCDPFTLFRDSRRIGANLKERPFDLYVGKYAASWTQSRRAPIASASGASPVPPGFNVPSAASIPPISIMVPEPTTPPANTGSVPAEASAAPPRRPAAAKPARPAPRPSQPAQASAPVPTAPDGANTGSAPPAANTGSAPRAQ